MKKSCEVSSKMNHHQHHTVQDVVGPFDDGRKSRVSAEYYQRMYFVVACVELD